jgi:UDP-N-acetylglucosamine diphosphorylase / glucose-1-phosphate thymidylyltransferase / UDP-N-acetylgalactosamine diphosphorylase / glucosamine-1-phosphate N-acetyltransferase / galactosamine-1-phosphate N-acetyltransferase
MDPFYPAEYFDLSTFTHASLFNEEEPVWIPLKKIGTYLLSSSLGNILGKVENGAFLIKPEEISIGKGSVVEPGAYILGPCIIGENCQVRQGAYIRGNVITGNRCIIGHATEVKNSIFFDGAQAGHFAYVGDSILGNHVNLGAGTKCANLRFDNHHVPIVWNQRRIDSGLRKFGAILGDYAQTGCNSVTNPGTLMGKKSRLAPCTAVQGIVPENYIVKGPESVMMAAHHPS